MVVVLPEPFTPTPSTTAGFCAASSASGCATGSSTFAMSSASASRTSRGSTSLWKRVFARLTVSRAARSEEHTSELQSLMRISYAVFCLKKKSNNKRRDRQDTHKRYKKERKHNTDKIRSKKKQSSKKIKLH